METTSEHILDAVERLIGDEGTRKLTIDAVAAEAGMSKGGILYNFCNKRELLLGVIRRAVTKYRKRTYELSEKLSAQGVACPVLRASFDIYRDCKNKATHKALFALAVQEPELVAEFHEMSGEFARAISDEADDPVIGHICELVVDGLYYRVAMDIETRSNEEIELLIDRVLMITSHSSQYIETKAEVGN